MAETTRAHTGESGNQAGREYFNPWREFCLALPSLVSRAHDARVEAELISETAPHPVSHRYFFVGAALLAVHPETRSTRTEAAYNSKPTEGGARVCAEERVFGRVEKDNRKKSNGGRVFWVPGLVVIGKPQEDGATGAHTETLWPCGETCWPRIITKKMPLDGLICAIRPDRRKRQIQTVEDLDNFYSAVLRGESPSEPPLIDKPEADWDEVVNRYDDIFPRDENPLASPENRQEAVAAAIQAIQDRPTLQLV